MSRWHSSDAYHQGERDFERNGRYGYDEERYRRWDDDGKEYHMGFDEASRQEERRQEEREAEDAEERVRERRAWACRQQEEEQYQIQEQEPEQEPPSEPGPPADSNPT